MNDRFHFEAIRSHLSSIEDAVKEKTVESYEKTISELENELERCQRHNRDLQEELDNSNASDVVDEIFYDELDSRCLEGLARVSLTDSRVVAIICDTVLDPSGTLLGKVRRRTNEMREESH